MRALLAVLLLAVLPGSAPAAAGDLDKRFGQSGRALIDVRGTDHLAVDLELQRDGRLVLAGNSNRGWFVARLLRSGRPDPSFGRKGRILFRELAGSSPVDVDVLADGRILVAGRDYGDGLDRVLRLLPDGRLDPAWGTAGRTTIGPRGQLDLNDMVALPDGGAALAVEIEPRQQSPRAAVVRLGPDGRPDPRFGDGGVFTDAHRGGALAIGMQPSGRLIVGGRRGWADEEPAGHELLFALTPEGRVDAGWADGGYVLGARGAAVSRLVTAPDGGVVALTSSARLNGALWLTPEGRARDDWGLAGRAPIAAGARRISPGRPALSPDGELYVPHDGRAGLRTAGLVRFDARGVADGDFGGADAFAALPNTKRTIESTGVAAAVAPGGRVYLAASGAGPDQEVREDFGDTHAIVARMKGWSRLARLSAGKREPGSRRLGAFIQCLSPVGCRLRVDVLDRRGRLIGRKRPKGGSGGVDVQLRRRLRRGERLTLRVHVSNRLGHADEIAQRVRVPRTR